MVLIIGKLDIDDPRERDLTRFQRMQLSMFGLVKIGDIQRDGWRAPIDHYLMRCPVHGLIVTYPKGFDQRLECYKCREEENHK